MRFVVPGRIRGKGRPRFARHDKFVRTFTDDKTVACEATVKHFASEAMKGRAPFEGPLWLTVTVWLIPPASWSKVRRSTAQYVTGKPDVDNVAKLIGDALNGIVWGDDSQISELEIKRRYMMDGPERVEIQVGQLGVLESLPVRKAAA